MPFTQLFQFKSDFKLPYSHIKHIKMEMFYFHQYSYNEMNSSDKYHIMEDLQK